MKNTYKLIGMVLMLFISSTACGLFTKNVDKMDELSTKAAEVRGDIVPSIQAHLTNVSPTLDAQLTRVAPTLQAQMDNLPTEAAQVGESFTDFSGAPEKIIIEIQDRMKTLKSYREDIETFKEGQSTSTMTFEVQMPDKIHANMISEGAETEIIMVDKDFYIKLGDSWLKMDAPMDLTQYMFSYQANPENISDYKLIGPDNLDGRPTMAFQYSYTTNEIEYTAKVWVGLLDGYIYKMEVDSVVENENYRTEMKLYGFNEDITIEPPIQ